MRRSATPQPDAALGPAPGTKLMTRWPTFLKRRHVPGLMPLDDALEALGDNGGRHRQGALLESARRPGRGVISEHRPVRASESCHGRIRRQRRC